jgi:hypothetical protein
MATKLDKHRVESDRSVVVATAPNKAPGENVNRSSLAASDESRDLAD